jgi:1,2-diacylglycerol 3-alpha-glucosyltransferase
MKEMKILIAADLCWPTINGVATFTRNLAQGMAARGHEVVVIAPSQTGRRYTETDGNYTIYRTVSVPFPFYQNFRISLNPTREVRRIIEKFDPDIIHIQMLMWIGQAAMRYGGRHSIPIIATNHAMPENLMDNLKLLAPLSRPINYVLREYGARFHAKADYVTMPTDSAITMFGAMDKVSVPMVAISNGIDLTHFHPPSDKVALRKKLGLPDGPIVTYVGRLDAEKHIPILLKAFADIQAQTGAHLLIVGGGGEIDNLKYLADDFGVKGKVIFTGRVSDEDLVLYHQVGDVFAMPSPAELQSIATLEAMASGLPVVAVDKGALRELCQDGVNGVLCEADNVDEIAQGIQTILSDKELMKKYADASLKIALSHDIQHTLLEFEHLYDVVIRSKQALLAAEN